MNMNLGWALTVRLLQRSDGKAQCLSDHGGLGRIASHLVAAGCYGLDLGSFTRYLAQPRARQSRPL